MKKVLCAVGLLLAVGCVWEPFAMYDYKAIIEVTPPAAQTISTVVVDIDSSAPPETTYLDTTYTLNVTVYLKEMTGKKFRFEGAECRLYDSKGGHIRDIGGATLIPPVTNEEQDSVAVAMKITLDEKVFEDIEDLDDANEAEKWNGGSGFLGFVGYGTEIDHALSVDCLEGFAPITVTRGSWRVHAK